MSTEMLVPSTRNLAAEANIADELNNPAFADLLKKTGEAVAKTQDALTDTAVATTSALASTLVDVIAVEEKQYNDQGELVDSISHVRKLPLLSLIDPVFYQWSSVRLQAQMYAKEFSTSQQSDYSSSSSSDTYGQAGIGFIFGVGKNTHQYRSYSQSQTRETADDVSWGRMRMSALLEPRDDVRIPKAEHAIRGPHISIIPGEIQAPTAETRTMSIMMQLNRRDGTPIANKLLAIETDGIPWTYIGGSATPTDTDGRVEILLTRTLVEGETEAIETTVSARLGLVRETQVIKF